MTTSPLSNLALQERTRREVLHRSELIPSLPDVVLEVLQLLNDGGAEIADFEEPLGNDAALVAKMLRVVNSPFYGQVREISSVREAVMVLGFRGLRSLVLAASTAKHLDRSFACYGFATKGLWRHSICVASAARTLAKSTGRGPDFCEEIFVAGLLHDIGKMLLGPYLTEAGVELARDTRCAADVERTVLGIDHQEAGTLIAEKWGLPKLVSEVIAHHHDRDHDAEHPGVLEMVRISNAFAEELGQGYVADHRPTEYDSHEDAVTLGLDDAALDQARCEMQEAMAGALGTLGNLGAT